MPEHTQPTREELEAKLAEVTVKLDQPETPEPSEKIPEEIKEDEEEEVVTPPDDVEAKSDEEEKPEEKKSEEQPIEDRLRESSKEAQKLAEDSKKISEAFHEANNLGAPTEEELKNEYPEWDAMDDIQHRLARESFVNKRKFDVLEKAAAERRVVEEWNDKVDDYITNPKTLVYNPLLEGKQEDFKAYAKSKENRNANFGLVVKSFLYDQEQSKVKHKGKMFETGTGGDKKKSEVKSEKLSVDEAARLRSTDYNKYKQYLIQGKISTEIA